MKVAVVILNWNGKKLLEKFLPSVINYCPDYAEIIIADNASTDDSIDFLNSKYKELKLVSLEKNFGYAEGYNRALKEINAEYFVLLNSDIEVTDGWIDHIISFMDDRKDIAACQPKILDFSNKHYFEYAGAAGGYIDKYGYPFCRGRLFNTLEADNGQYDDLAEVFWASGACLFIRSECFFSIGGFDKDFFAHMEEIDLCWRLKNKGYKIFSHPKSVVYHVGGATLDKSSPQKTYLNFRNNLCLIYKNSYGKNAVFGLLLFRIVLDFFAAFQFLFSSGLQHFLAVFRAYINFFGSLKYNKKKRNAIVQKNVSCIYKGSIVFNYFFKGSKTFSSLSKKDIS